MLKMPNCGLLRGGDLRVLKLGTFKGMLKLTDQKDKYKQLKIVLGFLSERSPALWESLRPILIYLFVGGNSWTKSLAKNVLFLTKNDIWLLMKQSVWEESMVSLLSSITSVLFTGARHVGYL